MMNADSKKKCYVYLTRVFLNLGDITYKYKHTSYHTQYIHTCIQAGRQAGKPCKAGSTDRTDRTDKTDKTQC